ncbi:MAG: alpha-ketoglutarate decarboxylase [Bacteroides sp. SM23_62]|nr:MAG: alpha-ketoglutarate decarboxylase [Bacteroides sp. SM23_62]
MEEVKEQILFGPNVWLIDEMYRQYLQNPDSVAESWRDFFADYKPSPFKTEVPQKQVETQKRPQPDQALSLDIEPLRGFAARIVENMEGSLSVPTATSTRIIPVKVLEENRKIINRHLKDTLGGKISFTHLIAWAILKAAKRMPVMVNAYMEVDGAPHRVRNGHINFGLAVDVERKDGTRSLLVPNIKQADMLQFDAFFSAYNDLLRKVRSNKIEPDDFMETNISLTNPGTIGTVLSVPRLMAGQSCIVATGVIDYPAEYQSADPDMIANMGISKVMTMTCTYDHRVIQGAESGMFLHQIHQLLGGEDDFYEEIFNSLDLQYKPIRLVQDVNPLFNGSGEGSRVFEKQGHVLQLTNMYRVRGHLLADINPLNREVKTHPELEPENYGLSLWDYDREFHTFGIAGRRRIKLREIIEILQESYCRTVGIEYMHIQDPAQKTWIQNRVEGVPRSKWINNETKRTILLMLNSAEAFENFLHTKYVGHKRFSLEGAETLIPMLNHLLDKATEQNIQEIIIGMSHRGRLNVLANILKKSYKKIFREFQGDIDPESQQGSGDVKYHLGAEGIHTHANGRKVKIKLASNPSHLEAVNPVVEGMVRARQDEMADTNHNRVLALLIHGDAAFAGQGVVAETYNLSQLHGYRTGGTIHIVVNNSIGFTTSPAEARSSFYATDVARMIQAPIFHVNGEDPEACVRISELALEFRKKFKKDVVIDMICYRRHGHNEGDEPSYTQPQMYALIKQKRSIRKLYTEALVNRGDLTLQEAESALEEYRKIMDNAFEETKDSAPASFKIAEQVTLVKPDAPLPTGISERIIKDVLDALIKFPEQFKVHPKLKKQILLRRDMLERNAIDWGLAEALAFGSLLLEGIPVRLSGQDSRRGTFSQRHSVLVDYDTGEQYTPLNNINSDQATFMIYDSLLSEYAALGFEYGYSVVRSNALVIWEAQFGDFVNGAQIIIDQFISSAEDKWDQKCRLVMLLPHGFEGQGPEHSSARLERFLTLCAENNMRIAIPTTAAQYFHLLRNQARREKINPLVVLTPKSLLRADVAKSTKQELIEGSFQVLIEDSNPPENPKKLVLCCGKIAYELVEYRKKNKLNDTLIVRLEQLYPFPFEQLTEIFQRYPAAKDIRWVQEEPRNMGSWNFALARIREIIPKTFKLKYVGRLPSASPAAGAYNLHVAEQELLLKQAFE